MIRRMQLFGALFLTWYFSTPILHKRSLDTFHFYWILENPQTAYSETNALKMDG